MIPLILVEDAIQLAVALMDKSSAISKIAQGAVAAGRNTLSVAETQDVQSHVSQVNQNPMVQAMLNV